jgi:hypothetical protein
MLRHEAEPVCSTGNFRKLVREGVMEPPTFRRLSNPVSSELQAAEKSRDQSLKTKSAYRPKNNIPTESRRISPKSESTNRKSSPPPRAHVELPEADPVEATVAAVEPPANEASEALKRQLQHLHASEQAERQHQAAMMAQRAQPPTRAALLQAWRSRGADEGDLNFSGIQPRAYRQPGANPHRGERSRATGPAARN